jgi:hypothetical protein
MTVFLKDLWLFGNFMDFTDSFSYKETKNEEHIILFT